MYVYVLAAILLVLAVIIVLRSRKGEIRMVAYTQDEKPEEKAEEGPREYDIDDAVIDRGDTGDIIEPLWDCVELYEGEKEYLDSLSRFSLPQRYVFAVENYMIDIDIMGHYQFYHSGDGILWEDAFKGCEAIGLEEYGKILKESVDRLGGRPSKEFSARQDQLKRIRRSKKMFDDLDDRFHQVDQEDAEARILRYIKNNRDSFLFKGKEQSCDEHEEEQQNQSIEEDGP